MKTKYLLIITALLLPHIATASDVYKYKKGDCITPTNSSYSWYGNNARIEAISKIEGYENVSYILAFPHSISNSVIFSTSIEKNTKKIPGSKCAP